MPAWIQELRDTHRITFGWDPSIFILLHQRDGTICTFIKDKILSSIPVSFLMIFEKRWVLMQEIAHTKRNGRKIPRVRHQLSELDSSFTIINS
jgi:hypothetical protein